jgi:outer membrane immunogenic protein
MKRLATALAVVALIGTPAFAADMARKMPVKAPPPAPAPVYNWTGLYFGGHVGGVWANADYAHINNGGVVEGFSQNASAVTGGIHGGGMYQWGNVVLGVEGTYSWRDLSATSVAPVVADRSVSFGSTNMGTVVGRVGWAWDRWLVYGQGGWATAKTGFLRIQTSTNFTVASSGSGWDDGWTGGAGVAYAIYNNIILGLEYDFARINIGTRSVTPFAFGLGYQSINRAIGF